MHAIPLESMDIETKKAAAPVSRFAVLATMMGNIKAVATMPKCCSPSRNIVGYGGLSSAAYSRFEGCILFYMPTSAINQIPFDNTP